MKAQDFRGFIEQLGYLTEVGRLHRLRTVPARVVLAGAAIAAEIEPQRQPADRVER